MIRAETPLHDWLRPRLHALWREAKTAGFAPDAVAAALIDLATMPPFNSETRDVPGER